MRELCAKKKKKNLYETKISLEPDSNQWPKDICLFQLQSSALPTELSREHVKESDNSKVYFKCLYVLVPKCKEMPKIGKAAYGAWVP